MFSCVVRRPCFWYFTYSATDPLSLLSSPLPSLSVQEYLGGALVQVGLCKAPNPIASIRMNARFAFLEMRSAEDATSALNLDGIPFGGAALSVGRPKKVSVIMLVRTVWSRRT